MINYLHVIYVDSGPTRALKSFRETRAELMKEVVRNEIWCFAVKNTGSDITHLKPIESDTKCWWVRKT